MRTPVLRSVLGEQGVEGKRLALDAFHISRLSDSSW